MSHWNASFIRFRKIGTFCWITALEAPPTVPEGAFTAGRDGTKHVRPPGPPTEL
jgi:hypothetical protein